MRNFQFTLAIFGKDLRIFFLCFYSFSLVAPNSQTQFASWSGKGRKNDTPTRRLSPCRNAALKQTKLHPVLKLAITTSVTFYIFASVPSITF